MPIEATQIKAKSLDASQLKDGSMTDSVLGNRTVNETIALESDTGSVTDLLSELAKEVDEVKGNTGKWFDTPVSSLAELFNNDIIQSVSGYVVPNNGSWGRIPIQRDMVLRGIRVECSVTPSAATTIAVYKNSTLLSTFRVSTIGTAWTPSSTVNLVAGDFVQAKVNGTSGLRTAPNTTTIFAILGNG